MKVKVAQSRPTLCYPMNRVVHGILQARILEWVLSPTLPASPSLAATISKKHSRGACPTIILPSSLSPFTAPLVSEG